MSAHPGKHVGAHQHDVVEVGEVEDLEVHPFGTGVSPLPEPRHSLVRCAAHAIGAQLVDLATDAGGPASELGLVTAHTDDERGRAGQLVGVAVDVPAGGADPVDLGGEGVHGGEREVVFGGETGGQRRRLGRPPHHR